MTRTDGVALQSEDIGKIGETAVQMFFQKWRWHPRKDSDDQGIDFSVEIPNAVDGLRRRFLVQVKTANPVTLLKSGDWSVPVEKGALRKYHSTREPVFLLAYDLPTEEIRFVHLQRWIADGKHSLDGTKDAELQVRMEGAQRLRADAIAPFQSSVLEAWSYQDARHFSAPQAIRHLEAEFSRLDTRFDLEVTASKRGYEFSIQAAGEPVEIGVTLNPSSSEDAKGFHDALKFGAAAKFNVNDMQMHGSPLFERMPRGPATIEVGSDPKCVTLRFGRIREKRSRNKLQKLIEVPGEMTKGIHGVEIRSTDSCLPFRFVFRSDFVEKQARADLTIAPERLFGTPLKALGVEKLHEMLQAGSDGILGMQVLLGDQPSPGPMSLRSAEDRSSFLVLSHQMARLVGLEAAAKRAKSQLCWGALSEITVSDEESWLTAWRLFYEGEAPIPGQAVVVNVANPEFLEAARSPGVFVITGAEYSVTGWGMEICRLPVAIELTGYKVTPMGDKKARVEPDAGAKTVVRLGKGPKKPASVAGIGSAPG